MPKITFLPGAKEAIGDNRRNRAKRRADFVPSFSQEKPTCPAGSSPIYRARFKKLTAKLDEIGLNSQTFENHIFMAVEKEVQVAELKALLKKTGTTYTVTNTRGEKSIRPRPEVALLRQAEVALRTLLKELGLTPAEHARIGLRRSKNPDVPASTGDWGDM